MVYGRETLCLYELVGEPYISMNRSGIMYKLENVYSENRRSENARSEKTRGAA